MNHHFERFFCGDCIVDCSAYMAVDDETLNIHRAGWAEKWKEGTDGDAEQLGAFCHPSHRVNAETYCAMRESMGGRVPHGVHVVSLMQAPDLFYNASPFMPRLLVNSYLFDLVSRKELIPLQHLLIQGFAVPGLVPKEFSDKFFPWPKCVSLHSNPCKPEGDCQLSEHQIRELAGNSFHVALMGAFYAFALSIAEVVDLPSDI